MRLTIFLLLFSLSAQGQFIIDSYRFGAAAGLLLDDYPNAASAYSLRLLRTAYTGDAIVVRRSSNNDTLAIGFSGIYLDTAALKTFCGTGATDTCFVRRWYDQSGNGNDVTQTTSAAQPKILISGVIVRRNSLPAMDFDGVDDGIIRTSFAPSGAAMSVARVYSTDAAAAADAGLVIYAFGNSANIIDFIGQTGLTGALSGEFTSFAFGKTGLTNPRLGSTTYRRPANTPVVEFENYLSSGFTFFQNASAVTLDLANNWTTTTNASPSEFVLNQLGIGFSFRSTSGGYQQQKAQEYVFWFNDQSTNRAAIETNINNFYSIY